MFREVVRATDTKWRAVVADFCTQVLHMADETGDMVLASLTERINL